MPKVRDLVDAVIAGNEDAVREALRRAASNPKTVLAVVELWARLNREIGPGAIAVAGDKDERVKVVLTWPDAR